MKNESADQALKLTLTLKLVNLKCEGATTDIIEMTAQPGQEVARYFTPIEEGEGVNFCFSMGCCKMAPSGANGESEGNVDPAIASYIEALWSRYDVDGSGGLDKMEAFRFAKDVFQIRDQDVFSDVWSRMDHDRSGQISKAELGVYMSLMQGR